jgi:hypothetical protein
VVAPPATSTATPAILPLVSPSPGLFFRTKKGLWRTDNHGNPVFLLGVAQDALISISPDGTRILDHRELEVVDLSTGEQLNLDKSEEYAMCCPRWWAAKPEKVLVEVQPGSEMQGPGFKSIPAAVSTDGSDLLVMGTEPTAIGPFAASPDGMSIAYDRSGNPWIYEWGFGAEPFDTTGYGFTMSDGVLVSHPAWSPSSKQLAWVVSSPIEAEQQQGIGRIGIFNLQKRTLKWLYPYEVEGFDGGRSEVYWSPDEKYLALHNFGKDLLWILAIDGASERFIQSASTAVWNPKGKWLAYVADGEVWVTSADGTETFELGAGVNHVWSPDGEWLTFGNDMWRSRYGNWIVRVDSWEKQRLDLPKDAYILDWQIAEP